ncbi:hypothetical protein EV44_g1948 [Erysiphe necator]|uniref:Uncharacterized protein n=1 Tax=Uncinula necator TaxID=52586 RepID=A0A0B1NXA3_UNCNE|nr:hypothetical protein EV44_g1948 [Erysiphe necator]
MTTRYEADVKSLNMELRPSISTSKPRFCYTLKELLRLRESLPLVKCNICTLSKIPDIASIFRLPDEVFRNPHHYVYHTKALTKFANEQRINYINKEIISQISEDGDAKMPATIDTNIHSPQKALWNLRRRGSNDKSDEPYSAPSGIIAQKTENFQKFYRAVVSPTHVRVTAGGRIVPNTKPTETSGLNLGSEKFNPNSANLDSVPASLKATTWPQFQPVQTRYPVVFNTGVSTPYNILQPGNLNNFSAQSNLNPSTDWNPAERSQIFNNSVNTSMRSRESFLPQGIKISHPSQFDQTKPFVLNGQLLYPLRTGPQVPTHAFSMPNGMLGGASSILQGHPSIFQQAPTPTALGNMTNSVAFPYFSQPPLKNLQFGQNIDLGLTSPYNLATGVSIPPVEILINQLRTLSNILNNLEIQKESKNSQCDGRFLEAECNSIKSQVNSIKSVLALHFPDELKAENKDLNDESLPNSDFHTNHVGPEIATSDQKAAASKTEIEAQESGSFEENSRTAIQANSYIKSRLSISSAKAPPFQPRSQTTIKSLSKKESNQKMPNIQPAEIFSHGSKKSNIKVLKGSIKLKNENLDSVGSPFIQSPTNKFKSIPPLSTHDNSKTSGMSYIGPNTKSLEAPYLIGTFPNGSQYNPSRPFDVVYSRPLNDEEIHARYLYFGKVPRNSQSGLPKFDGKDFYPPSPSKKNPSLKSSHPEINAPSKCDLNTATSYSPRKVAEAYTSKTNSPIRSSRSLQNLNSKSQSFLDSNNDDYSSISLQISKSPQGKGMFKSHTFRSTKNVNRAEANKIADCFMKDDRIEIQSSSNKQEPDQILQKDVSISFQPSNSLRNQSKESRIFYDQDLVHTEHVNLKSKASLASLGKVESHKINPKIKIQISPKMEVFSSNTGKLFTGRVESFHSANQQTLFLQNLLKRNTHILPLLGSALSAAINSENARGYLPQYRGSAIASFFPMKLPNNISGVEVKCLVDKKSKIHQIDGLPSCGASAIDSNNLKLNADQRLSHPAFAIGPVASSYMRTLTQRELGKHTGFKQ